VQTLASFFLTRRVRLPPGEERFVEVEPGIRLLCHCHWQRDRRSALTAIVVHGLEGSSDSQYVLGITSKGLAAGMNIVRMNQRNCGGTDHLAPTLYNSSLSGDLAAVARNLIERDGVPRFTLVGFSMGGNLALKLAGEWGSAGPPQFRGVAAVCPAMDLAPSADALHEPANRLYEYHFLLKLMRRFRRKARLFPGRFETSRLAGISSLREFDDKITAHYCGFEGAADYYARASASNVVDRIAVPALIIHAANDPFIRILPASQAKLRTNPNVTFLQTADGGHCAFLGEPNGYDGHWAEHRVVEFLRGL